MAEQDKNSVQTVISHDVDITGDIKTSGNIQFDGSLKGNLEAVGVASFGKTTKVEGNIKAESVVIAGIVKGNVIASDRLDMKGTAKIEGDIRSKRLTVEDGVSFNGKVEVNPAGFAAGAPVSGTSASGAPAFTPGAPASAPDLKK